MKGYLRTTGGSLPDGWLRNETAQAVGQDSPLRVTGGGGDRLPLVPVPLLSLVGRRSARERVVDLRRETTLSPLAGNDSSAVMATSGGTTQKCGAVLTNVGHERDDVAVGVVLQMNSSGEDGTRLARRPGRLYRERGQ